MARRHVMTQARKTALRKAQLASARKRRKGGRVVAVTYSKGRPTGHIYSWDKNYKPTNKRSRIRQAALIGAAAGLGVGLGVGGTAAVNSYFHTVARGKASNFVGRRTNGAVIRTNGAVIRTNNVVRAGAQLKGVGARYHRYIPRTG